jgi:hypothetical protein
LFFVVFAFRAREDIFKYVKNIFQQAATALKSFNLICAFKKALNFLKTLRNLKYFQKLTKAAPKPKREL